MPLSAEIYYFLHSKEGANQIPVVLIHGAGGMHLYWPPVIRRLQGYRIYTLDLPGHGKSFGAGRQSISDYTADVKAWMDRVGLDNAVIIGHSMGSAIAQKMALKHSKRVRGLILLGAGARLRVHPNILMGIADPINFHNIVKLVIEWAFAPQASTRLVEIAGQRMAEIQPAILQGDFMACNDFDIISQLGEIDCPVLVICGEEDRMTPTRYARFLVDHIRGAELEIIPGCGHMAMLEKPDEVKWLIQRFLKQISEHDSSQNIL